MVFVGNMQIVSEKSFIEDNWMKNKWHGTVKLSFLLRLTALQWNIVHLKMAIVWNDVVCGKYANSFWKIIYER